MDLLTFIFYLRFIYIILISISMLDDWTIIIIFGVGIWGEEWELDCGIGVGLKLVGFLSVNWDCCS